MMGPWTVVATDEFEEWMIGMKELRCTSEGHLRVLFMFMPIRLQTASPIGRKVNGENYE